MKRVMLVDDEVYVINLLKKIIDWDSLGLEICCEANDGEQAAALMEEHLPDIIIADINMPKLDGLQFSELILSKYVNKKIILLTGLEVFHYARYAVNIGVFYFLLKPVDKKELEAVLLKASRQIDMELEKDNYAEIISTRTGMDVIKVKEKFLFDIISEISSLSDNVLTGKFKDYNIKLKGNKFIILVVEIDRLKKLFETRRELEECKIGVKEIIDSIFHEYGNYESFYGNNDLIYVIIGCLEDNNIINLMLSCEKICEFVKEAFNFSVTIGCGTEVEGIEGLYNSYCHAQSALKHKFVLGDNRVIKYNSIEANESRDHVLTIKKRNEVMMYLRKLDIGGLKKVLEKLFSEFGSRNVTVENIQIICIELVMACLEFLGEIGNTACDVFGRLINPLEEMNNKETLEDMKDWIITLFSKTIEHVMKSKVSSAKKIVEKAVKFIEENKSEPELSVRSIAENMHLNQDYLSSVFKMVFSIPLVKYINNFRLETAKQFMDEGSCNIAAIAKKTGYSDSNYFSKSFKKMFGISPSSYIEQKVDKLT